MFLKNSTVDWCEPNYARSSLVAEWQNTLSCLPMVAAGLFGCGWSPSHRRDPDNTLFVLLTVVGVASMAFHATLVRWAQAMDELSLLLLVGCAFERLKQRKCVRARAALAAGAVGTALMNDARLQPAVFQLTFACACLQCYVLLARRLRKWTHVAWFGLATANTGTGVLAWMLDYHACNTSVVSLHAVWHVCCAFSLFTFAKIIVAVT